MRHAGERLDVGIAGCLVVSDLGAAFHQVGVELIEDEHNAVALRDFAHLLKIARLGRHDTMSDKCTRSSMSATVERISDVGFFSISNPNATLSATLIWGNGA